MVRLKAKSIILYTATFVIFSALAIAWLAPRAFLPSPHSAGNQQMARGAEVQSAYSIVLNALKPENLMAKFREGGKWIQNCAVSSIKAGRFVCIDNTALKNALTLKSHSQPHKPSPQPTTQNNSVSNPSSTQLDTPSRKQELINLLKGVEVVNEKALRGRYRRKDWKHWIGYNKSPCWNIREESIARVGNIQTDSAHCKILKGKVKDSYDGEMVDVRGVEVDHIVPLKRAAISGGENWDKKKKEEYANDIDDVLRVTKIKWNRQKGAKGIGEWAPQGKKERQQYAIDYMKVIKKYGLKISEKDKEAVEKIIAGM